MSVRYQTELPHPPETVFAVACDTARQSEWVVGLESHEPLDDGLPAVGHRFRQTLHYGPLKLEVEGRVTAWEPPHRVAFELDSDQAGLAMTIELAPGGAGTRVVHTAELRPKTLMLRLMAGKIDAELEKKLAADYAALTRVLAAG